VVFLDLGNTMLHLVRYGDDVPRPDPRSTHVAIEVDDVEGAAAAVRARGLKVLREPLAGPTGSQFLLPRLRLLLLILTLLVGCSGLLVGGFWIYQSATPVSARVVDPQGRTLTTADSIKGGQAVYQKHGLASSARSGGTTGWRSCRRGA